MKGDYGMREHRIRVDVEKCIGCGLCRKDCPAGNILLPDKKAVILSQNCIKCGHCVAICPKAAVSMTGFDDAPVEIKEPVTLDPQQLEEAIRTRRSIRHFTARPVKGEAIRRIIEAGRLTPTGGNAQEISYLVLKNGLPRFEKIAVRFFRMLFPLAKLLNPAVKNAVIDEHFFFKKAPAAILVLSKNQVDGALAASNMELMAEACGLGVLYSGFFSMAANFFPPLRKALGLKRGDKVVTTLVLGYSAVNYRRTAQKEKAAVRIL